MDTKNRIEKAKEILASNDGDKILQVVAQLIIICSNQQTEIEELKRNNSHDRH